MWDKFLEVGLLHHEANAPGILTDPVTFLIHWAVNFCLPATDVLLGVSTSLQLLTQHLSPEVNGTLKCLSNTSESSLRIT